MSPLSWHIDKGSTSVHVAVRGRPDSASMTAWHIAPKEQHSLKAGGLTVDMSAVPTAGRVLLATSTASSRQCSMIFGTALLLCDADHATKAPTHLRTV